MNQPSDQSPFQVDNIRQFIKFRVFFNSRFYYPVFTILFLDFGLTLGQFALLNAAWAATIVLFEVPSGALADTFGRRNLLICTGVLMVVEIAILCFVPRGNPGLLFGVFLANRILSGTAEASASGADEALAYDTLVQIGSPDQWGRVLEKQMRLQSAAYIVAMSVGAAVYDPHFMTGLAEILGLKWSFTQDMTIRYPLFLTLIMAISTLWSALRMREVVTGDEPDCLAGESCVKSMTNAFRLTLKAGQWILKTPWAWILIGVGLIFDHVIRMMVTLSSQYYRLIDLPEASFGLIGSGLAVLGLFIPRVTLKLVERQSPAFNLGIVTAMTLAGLAGMVFFVPFFGLVPVVLLSSVMYMQRLFLSHYLNRITTSRQRATVLSFKGLSFNLAYGLLGLFYAFVLTMLRSQALNSNPTSGGQPLENELFISSVGWFPWYFLLLLLPVVICARRALRKARSYSIENYIRQVSD